MLICITTKCLMECSHCMMEASSEGEHMAPDTFNKTLAFIKQFNLPIMPILVSGGEPTLNPHWEVFIERLLNENYKPCLLSNGMWLDDEDICQKMTEFMKKGLLVQVTHIKELYPKKINYKKAKEMGIRIEKELQTMVKAGRAKKNNITYHTYRKSPFCFNPRSISKNVNNLSEVIGMLMNKGKFCTPFIMPNGEVKFGEMLTCYILGSVTDKFETIFNNLRNMSCGKCGLYKNLSPMHLAAIEK
ncbi:radical SAM protein [Candidatus Margulisiibacteriota bacterium]